MLGIIIYLIGVIVSFFLMKYMMDLDKMLFIQTDYPTPELTLGDYALWCILSWVSAIVFGYGIFKLKKLEKDFKELDRINARKKQTKKEDGND